MVTITPSALAAVTGTIRLVIDRVEYGRALIPFELLKEPAVICALAYFTIGVLSGIFAEDKSTYLKEVIQRTLIIIVPLYLFSCGPKHPRELGRVLLAYLPAASITAMAASVFGVLHGFHTAAYVLGLHKNANGANCQHMILISAAFLVTRQYPSLTKLFWACIGLGILGLIATQARAALLAAVLGIFIMLLLIRAPLRYLVSFGIALTISFVGLVQSLPKEQIEHAVTMKKFSSNEERQRVWTYMSERLTSEPATCVGWGNYLHVRSGERYVSDAASIFFMDWFQMSIFGLIAQIAMIVSCLWLPLRNTRRCHRYSLLTAINLSALTIVAGRFLQSYLDSFWIGRGPTLCTFAAVGMALFVKLWLNQEEKSRLAKTTRTHQLAVGSADNSSRLLLGSDST